MSQTARQASSSKLCFWGGTWGPGLPQPVSPWMQITCERLAACLPKLPSGLPDLPGGPLACLLACKRSLIASLNGLSRFPNYCYSEPLAICSHSATSQCSHGSTLEHGALETSCCSQRQATGCFRLGKGQLPAALAYSSLASCFCDGVGTSERDRGEGSQFLAHCTRFRG